MYVRISKYNPKFRDENGVFLRSEWSSLSDIDDKKYKMEDYLEIERLYLKAFHLISVDLNLKDAIVSGIEFYDDDLSEERGRAWHSEYSSALKKYKKMDLWDGKSVQMEAIDDLIPFLLREVAWFVVKFDDDTYLTVGHDYYMHVGSKRNFVCPDISGIFVEELSTPFIDF